MAQAHILYLVPDLVNRQSGIARHSRTVCRALLDAQVALTVVALLDQSDAADEAVSSFPSLIYHPCHGSKSEFTWQSFKAMIDSRPDIVLLAHPNFAPLGWLLARLVGACWLSFVHGIDAWEPLKPARRKALQRADRILSISHFTAEKAAQANQIPSAKIRILHNCLDPQFECRPPIPCSNGSLNMLTVARLNGADNRKGHIYVIQAMPQLLARFPNLTYHIIGDGPRRSELERLAIQEGVADAVHFCGQVSEEDLRRHYASDDIFLMPSRQEGFGLAFLEAMSQGLPVIGGNLDATSEVVADGETGFLVNPTSVDSIVAAASRLLGDERLRLQMGQAAVQHVAAHFNFNSFCEKLIGYLAELHPDLLPVRDSVSQG